MDFTLLVLWMYNSKKSKPLPVTDAADISWHHTPLSQPSHGSSAQLKAVPKDGQDHHSHFPEPCKLSSPR